MGRFLIALIFSLILALSATAQDEGETGDVAATEGEESAEATAAEATDDEEEEVDLDADPDLDEQTYEEDEDDFVPSEEIPADEPIPFPSNI